MARHSNGESALRKHVRVLDAFTTMHPTRSLSAIEDVTKLSHATAHRVVGALVAEGLLERQADGEYRLGVKLWELASRTPGGLGLRELSKPWMNAVHLRVRQHTQLTVMNGLDALCIERMSTQDAVVNTTLIGGRMPLPLSSSGIVLLAHSRPEVLEAVIARGWEPQTRHSITDERTLRDRVARARADGYAVLDGHIYEDSRGIAVPILGANGEPYAALGVVVPNEGPVAHATLELLAVAAAGIARALADAYLPNGGAGDRHHTRPLEPLISPSKATLEYFATVGEGGEVG